RPTRSWPAWLASWPSSTASSGRAPRPSRTTTTTTWGGFFNRLKQYLHSMLDSVVEPGYKSRPFVGAGPRLQVQLEPSWLEKNWPLFVGVMSPLQADGSSGLLTQAGKLDLKIGRCGGGDPIFHQGNRGLMFTHVLTPPRALPSLQGLIYFQINRESQQEEWRHVQRSLSVAIRLNESHIKGDLQGQEVLQV